MMLDVFKGDAFKFSELVTAINKIPYVPTKIGSMGLFSTEGIYTPDIMVEMQNGVLTLVPSAPRGAPGVTKNPEKRTVRNFRTVHLPQRVAVMADEVLGIRTFGSQSETETAQALLNKKFAIARRDLDLTHEWQRMGAIKGQVLDADGTTVLVDFFTEFGLSQQVVAMDLDVDATRLRTKINDVIRKMEDVLGGVQVGSVVALCSKEFFDALQDHPAVTSTFLYTDGAALRKGQRMQFEFGDILWVEYRGQVGATRFIASGEAYAIPVGVPDLFKSLYAPAPYMDTVGTLGVPFYAAMEEMEFNKGVAWEIQSNPLHMCNRPDAIIKLTLT